MKANTRLYILIFIGLIPLLIVGLTQLIYKLLFNQSIDITSITTMMIGLLILYDIIIFILLLCDIVLSIKPEEISISRETNDKFSINRNNSIKITVSNFSAQELICVIKDDIPDIPMIKANNKTVSNESFKVNLPSGSKGELFYNLKPNKRGEYNFENVNLCYISRFKLFWRLVKYPLPKLIKVYPDLESLKELSIRLSKSSGLGETKIRRFGEGTEFSSLREYVPGDDVKRIDWHATARRDHPIVKTYEVSRDQTVLILIDGGRLMSTSLSGLTRFDWAINATLSLSLAALHKGDQVGVGLFAENTKLFLPPKRGKINMKNIIESLYNAESSFYEPDYVGVLANFSSYLKKRALVVVITDLVDALASKALLRGMASLSPRHLPFCVTFNDKKVISMAYNQAEEIQDVYRQSVSLDLLESRIQALTTLKRKGGLVLDVPPEDLSNSIVERYLAIKAKNLI